MICPVPLLSCPVTITNNSNGKGQKGWDICPLPLPFCPLPLPFCPLPLPFDVSVSKKVNFFFKTKKVNPIVFFALKY